MKSSFFKSLKHLILSCILCFTFTVLFTSCENFLKASEIREEIEKVIDYNNAQKVLVLIRADEGTGSFLVEGEKEFTVNFTEAELQFTANTKAIVFKGLEAVSKTNPTVSRNDCVEFSTISGDKDSGIYKVSIRIIKKETDILIKPKYILKPAVISVSPVSDATLADLTTPIKLKFNQSFENILSVDEDPIFNFNNIKIRYQGFDISNYFYEPIISNDNDTVVIYPKGNTLNSFFQNNSVTNMDIAVQLIPSKMNFLINDEIVHLSYNNSMNYIFQYTNTGADTTTPENNGSIHLYNDERESSPLNLTYIQIQNDNYNLKNLNDYAIESNRTNGIVYISGIFIDEGSGLNSITVEEHHINDSGEMEEKTITKTYRSDDENIIRWAKTNQTGNKIRVFFKVKHYIQSEDGLTKLDITAKDAYDNQSEYSPTFYVIKTSGPDMDYFSLFNWYVYRNSYEDNIDSAVSFNMNDYQSNLKNIKLIYIPDDLCEDEATEGLLDYESRFAAYYCGRAFDPTQYFKTIKCEYYDDDGVLQSWTMNKHVYTEPELCFIDENTGKTLYSKNWNHTLINVKDVSGLPVKIIITDDLGNTSSKTYTFPQKLLVSSINDTTDTTLKAVSLIPNGKPETYDGLVVYKEDDDDDNSWKAYQTFYLETEIKDGYTYQFIPFTWGLTGNLSQEYNNLFDSNKPKEIELNGDITFNKSTDPSKLIITIPIKNEAWSIYDSICIKLMSTNTSGQDSCNGSYKFNNKESLLQIEKDLQYLYNIDNDDRIIITGIQKNGKISKEKLVYLYQYLPDNINSFDNIPPTLYCPKNYNSTPYNFFIQSTDYQSGLKSVEIFIGSNKIFNKTFSTTNGLPHLNQEFNVQSYFKTYVKGYNLDSETVSVKFIATDYNNNTKEQSYYYDIEKSLPVYLYSTDESYVTLYTENKVNDALIQKFGISNTEWTDVYSIPSASNTPSGVTVNYQNRKSTIKIPKTSIKGSFIRMTNGYSVAQYYYVDPNNTVFLNSGRYDDLRTTSTPNTFIVSSDAPVFVHTIVTNVSFDECSNWSLDDWEFYKRQVGNRIYAFEARNQKEYTVPTRDIQSGECYIVVAYFADGTSKKSNVMVKN